MWGAVDPVAGPYAQTVSGMIRDGGQYVLYSRLGGMTANVGISDLLYRGVTVRRLSNMLPFPCWFAFLAETAPATHHRRLTSTHFDATSCRSLSLRSNLG